MSEAASSSEALLFALEDLEDDDFERFKLHLEDADVLGEYEAIRRKNLKSKDRTEILKTMKDHYGIFTISVMKRLLKTLNCRFQLEKLCQCQYHPEALIAACRKEVQSKLKKKFNFLMETHSKLKAKVGFNEGYTELFLTEADTEQVEQVDEGHKVQMERTLQCQDIFRGSTETGDPIRVVLTKGVSGVGKTVLTQKFSLDWAEGRANQDVQLLFHFTLRDLNKFENKEFSLVELLHHCFRETQTLFSFQCLQLLFIFDGVDECRLNLDFSRYRVVTEPTESASVEQLLVNLIRGDLLPSARLWITTRPATASLIQDISVSMVTELRGFTDEQKEEYFMKRFKDSHQATEVIALIKTNHSLYIMSRIPIFCWIISTVLQKLLLQPTEPVPKTLTQLYVHFLVVQAKVKNVKYHGRSGADNHWTPETKELVLRLGKLAFEQLLKGKMTFQEHDLSEYELNAAEIAHHSGVFTEVFREDESGLYQEKVYCFIHLSVQEFLAALHVHQAFLSSGENLLSPPPSLQRTASPKPKRPYDSAKSRRQKIRKSEPRPKHPATANAPKQLPLISQLQSCFQAGQKPMSSSESDEEDRSSDYEKGTRSHSSEAQDLENKPTPEDFYRSAVDQALRSPNGHLDLFLRFLLGLSLSTNQRLLPGQLLHKESDQTTKETVKYIKEKLNKKSLSAESSLNLLHCLSELNDSSLLKHIQRILRDSRLSWLNSRAQWSALSFLLLSSNSDLEHFDLRKYCPSDNALLGLLPVVKASTKSTLSLCGLSSVCCAALASVLSSWTLTELDLSNNHLEDSGVELLCKGLKSAPCRLQTLRLSGCLVSHKGGAYLAAALSSTSSSMSPASSSLSSTSCSLRELDLSYNHPGPSAELLTALRAPHGPLQTLRLDPAGQRWMVPGLRKYSCELVLDPQSAHKGLVLSEDLRCVTCDGVKQKPRLRLRTGKYSDRFSEYSQVLSSSGLRGRSYWEVEWEVNWTVSSYGLRQGVVFAVSYSPKQECLFGEDAQSWSLEWCDGFYSARHNGSCERRDQPPQRGGVIYPCPRTVGDRPEQSGRAPEGPRVTPLSVTTCAVVPSLSSQILGKVLAVSAVPQPLDSPIQLKPVTVCAVQPVSAPQTIKRSSGRVGVFLDWEGGALSFYEVRADGGLHHIYTFSATFSQPLFPGFGLREGSSVTLLKADTP